ncbi:CYFIP-related Rac1 interactor B [Taenia solium]|eukprot:TsM_000373900 transcript=TsM_000373900 gene=TsM_000373900
MGNIIRLLTSRFEEIKDDVDIFVDFENCQPSDEEYDLWIEINTKLAHTDDILTIVRDYPGAAAQIRNAIEHYADDAAQQAAWEALIPLVHQLRICYDFGVYLAQTVPRLLHALCSDELTVWEHLESQQALFKQFAEILDFIMQFDNLKMTKPSIQNDFSFYRRLRQRRRPAVDFARQVAVPCDVGDAESFLRQEIEELSDECCSKMSLFYAEANPMLKLISRYATQCHMVDAMTPMGVTSECLAAMAHICRGLLVKPSLRSRVTRDDTLMLLLRVMTGVIILYDHIDPYGVFRKTSKLDVKSCVRLLKEQNPKSVQCLLNAIKYSTLHFTDETTPRVIKQLLATTA